MNIDDDVESIAEDITRYLTSRPGASDSLDGVAHWWLPQQRITIQMSRVSQALELLAHQGKVTKSKNSKGETIYSLITCDSDDSVSRVK